MSNTGTASIGIGGFKFTAVEQEVKKGSNRGRKSPVGKTAKLPFNIFVFELLEANAARTTDRGEKEKPLTDPQLVAILKEEYSHVPKLYNQFNNTPGYIMSQLRSNYNRHVLATQKGFAQFPSYAVNELGHPIHAESGRQLTSDEICKKSDQFYERIRKERDAISGNS